MSETLNNNQTQLGDKVNYYFPPFFVFNTYLCFTSEDFCCTDSCTNPLIVNQEIQTWDRDP